MAVAVALVAVSARPGPAAAGGYEDLRFHSAEAPFADVRDDLENAIIGRGFKIDHHGYIGNMLKRTGADVGATKVLYKDAEYFQFCSATLSRNAMEADPRNIGFCPYVLTVYERADTPGTVTVVYRRLGEGTSEASKKALGVVNALLDEIAREATGN